MKILFIGGSGNISGATSKLAINKGIDLYHLNRGSTDFTLKGVRTLNADVNDVDELKKVLAGHEWDVVVNWIAFKPEDIQRDFELFKEKTKQYIFISSASAYQKPCSHPIITESTPLINPYWDYSRDKIACEELCMKLYTEYNFPVTIVRPSLTYDTVIPVAIGSWDDYTIVDRMLKGQQVIVHGDGTSIWTVTHSEDFGKGFVGLLGHQQAIGHSFHITSDELLTWNQIYEAVGDAVNVKPNIIHIPSDFICEESKKIDWTWMGGDFQTGNLKGDKAVSTIFDNTKIKTFVPDFVANIPFNKGIKRTIDWFQADKSRMLIHDDNNKFMDTIIRAYLK